MFLLPGANKMIKAITFIFFFVIVVFLLSHCKKDNPTPRSYPRLRNTVVSDITEKDARFSADLYSIGTEKIIEHGFVWGTTDPNIYYSDRIQLGPCDTPGIYSACIASTLKKDIKYTVKSYVQTADHLVYGIPTDFKSLGSSAPVIYDFYPHSAGWLDTLTIKGENFSWVPAENVVSLNQTECKVLTATDKLLKVLVSSDLPDLKSVVSVPAVLPRNNARINIQVGGYKRSLPITNHVKSKWLMIPLPHSFQWNALDYYYSGGGISFTLDGIGYFMDNNSHNLTSFNPVTSEFVNLGTFPIPSNADLPIHVVCRDTVYAMSSYLPLSRYDVTLNKWISTGAKPPVLSCANAIAFSLNDKIYFGLPFSYSLDNSFEVYNPATKGWISKKSFPSYSSACASNYFSLNNKGYVLFEDNKFCQYDPDNDEWTELARYPGFTSNHVGKVLMIINDKVYVGSGKSNGTLFNQMWYYDPLINTWIQSTDMPFSGRSNSISFAINNKGYFGFGFTSTGLQNDFYEFDPDYPLY